MIILNTVEQEVFALCKEFVALALIRHFGSLKGWNVGPWKREF
jgi:hypothetical protein